MKPWALNQLIRRTLREDAVNRDITTNSLIPGDHRSEAVIIVRQEAIVCGLKVAARVFKLLDPSIRFQDLYSDGSRARRNSIIARIKGKTRTILTGERVALNFLGYLSGISTDTQRFVQKIADVGAQARILDTRKTTPGLRLLEKYAVKCGGGHNHRPDLSELVLIKDNHRHVVNPVWSIPEAIMRARKKSNKAIEIEVDTLKQFEEALSANPEMILLDNMTCPQMKRAVEIVKKLPPKKRPTLEASGGITLRRVAQVARTGVDCISVGSLTHSNKAVDVSLELVD